MESQEQRALLVLKESPVHKVSRVLLEPQGQLVHRVLQVLKAFRV
jgi:hypothetical protein